MGNLIDSRISVLHACAECRIVMGLSRYHVRVIRFRPSKVNGASKGFFLQNS